MSKPQSAPLLIKTGKAKRGSFLTAERFFFAHSQVGFFLAQTELGSLQAGALNLYVLDASLTSCVPCLARGLLKLFQPPIKGQTSLDQGDYIETDCADY